ncbi:MAG: ATP-grasp domain-containing protein [Candidatus Gastranaerophilales bacterium]|nr:ATP-grasp domain-containing protein [Candidatus Gastranaerophilales bacterium]
MFILNDPYISDFLIETIKQNNYKVLDYGLAKNYFSSNNLISNDNAKAISKLYLNSENSIDWIIQNKPDSLLTNLIKISKDKALFRKMLSKIYPDYYFREVNLDELKKLDSKNLKYPFVLKPSVGFLSFGVYPIYNENDFKNVVLKIDSDIEKLKGVFPLSVVDCTNFLIEEMIEGEEFAIDAYFDENGEAIILNIFQHPFLDKNDVSDRVYYTSKSIIQNYLKPFKELLDKIAKEGNYKNFPFHLELRMNENKIIPIEINPMRFCGWCITDIAYFAWEINPYIYFMENKKPDWEEILKSKNNDYFYFTIGDIPSGIDKTFIKKINFEKYLKNISNPLEIRKIDYKTKPVFAIVFGRCNNIEEINNLLKLNMKEFIELEKY